MYLVVRCDPNGGLECLGAGLATVAAAALGGIVGALGGCFLMLRHRYERAGLTAILLLVVAFPALSIAGVISTLSSGRTGKLIILALATALLPLAARRLALIRSSPT